MHSLFVVLFIGITVVSSTQARYSLIPVNNWGSDQRTPSSVMVDVTNNLGLLVLECHNINNFNNIAFSPYGLTSVLVALHEGVKGEGAVQVERVARFPYDLDVVRVGFRDIHRLLRSYFLPQEGFLAGLSLSNDNITFTSEYVSILRFYGYDVETSKNPASTTTTSTTEQANNDEPETEKTEPVSTEANEEPPIENTEENTEENQTEEIGDDQSITKPPLLPTPTPTTAPPENTPNSDSSDTEETPTEDTAEVQEDVSPETLENTNNESTESASVSVDSSETTALNDVENFSTEESVTITETTVDTTTILDDTATEITDTTTAEVTRKKKSIEDFLIARYYDREDSAKFGGYSLTPTPPINAYPFLANGIAEQFNVNYTEYDAILPFAYIPSVRALALKFPLDSDKYYLLILLPLNPLGVNDLICDIRKYETLRKIILYLKDTYVRAIVPSFMLKGFVFLTTTLQRLGLQNVFEPNRADFSAMTLEKNIYVTNIEQAVTVTIRNYEDPKNNMKKRRYLNYRPMEFKATHPFLYFIMDSTLDVTLMAGKVINPVNSRIQ